MHFGLHAGVFFRGIRTKRYVLFVHLNWKSIESAVGVSSSVECVFGSDLIGVSGRRESVGYVEKTQNLKARAYVDTDKHKHL